MTTGAEDQEELKALEDRLRAILPEVYQHCYEDVQPVSMGTAALKYGSDGKVAWHQMWATYCDLAMAGGPPHKGTLLESGSGAEIGAAADRYRQVVEEIGRGVGMVTGLPAERSPIPGWVRVTCETNGMAAWLVRAIVMENVSACHQGAMLDLPAGPDYRIEKEIKNVVTVIAKTSHYWWGHMGKGQRQFVADLFEEMELESPLLEPPVAGPDMRAEESRLLSAKMAEAIQQATGLRSSNHRYAGWLGLVCPNVGSAIWMMRSMVASNVLSRREETVLFVPVNPASDPNGEIVVRVIGRIHGFAATRSIF
jgi:sirohydrochlorin cobaltochelatase